MSVLGGTAMTKMKGFIRLAGVFGLILIGGYAAEHLEIEPIYILGGVVLIIFAYFENKLEDISSDLTVLEELFEEVNPDYTTGSGIKFRKF